MKNLIVVLFVIATEGLFGQNLKSVTNSEIKNVRVYLNGAQVERNVKATVEAGITQLKLESLSSLIDKNSISVSGTGEVTLLSVVHQMNYLNDEKKSPEIKQAEDSLEALQTDMEKASGLESIYNEETALLNSNKSVGGANSGVDPDNLKEVADFFRERMIELKIKLIDIHKEQKRLSEKIQKMNQQLAALNAKRNRPTSTILITVSSKARTAVNLNVSYYMSGASWSPVYDIRAKDVSSPVQVTYKADITQNTGEDWNDVKLTLSSGNPAQGGAKPELNPWYLDFYAPMYKNQGYMDRVNAPAAMELKSVEIISSDASQPIQGLSSSVVVDDNQLSTDFEIQLPYSVPSDGKKYSVDVQSFNLPATYSYFAVPKLDKDAFLLARITGWEELNLLAGKANVYFEGGYVGESIIDPRNTKDTLDLSLGRDKKIVITREKKKELSTSKFVGGNVVKELNYEITVRNTKKDNINISLEDQIPVSRNGDIKVNNQETGGGNFDEDTGKVTWKITVPPGMTEKRKLGFTVKYPKDKVVNGL